MQHRYTVDATRHQHTAPCREMHCQRRRPNVVVSIALGRSFHRTHHTFNTRIITRTECEYRDGFTNKRGTYIYSQCINTKVQYNAFCTVSLTFLAKSARARALDLFNQDYGLSYVHISLMQKRATDDKLDLRYVRDTAHYARARNHCEPSVISRH